MWERGDADCRWDFVSGCEPLGIYLGGKEWGRAPAEWSLAPASRRPRGAADRARAAAGCAGARRARCRCSQDCGTARIPAPCVIGAAAPRPRRSDRGRGRAGSWIRCERARVRAHDRRERESALARDRLWYEGHGGGRRAVLPPILAGAEVGWRSSCATNSQPRPRLAPCTTSARAARILSLRSSRPAGPSVGYDDEKCAQAAAHRHCWDNVAPLSTCTAMPRRPAGSATDNAGSVALAVQ